MQSLWPPIVIGIATPADGNRDSAAFIDPTGRQVRLRNNVGELLSAAVSNHKNPRQFLDRPGRREAAGPIRWKLQARLHLIDNRSCRAAAFPVCAFFLFQSETTWLMFIRWHGMGSAGVFHIEQTVMGYRSRFSRFFHFTLHAT